MNPVREIISEEIDRLHRLIDTVGAKGRVDILETVSTGGLELPIVSISMGSHDANAPVFGLFAGVHGLEKIGSHLAFYYLESLFAQWDWNRELRDRLEKSRLVTIPIINPSGMHLGTRSNINGVDLMRNSPTEADEKPLFLVGGHRYTPKIPWYRGSLDQPMEKESCALINYVKKEMFGSPVAFALDLHSGFGMLDRLWYPFAKSKTDFPRINDAKKFSRLLDEGYPFHVYKIEAQSQSYLTHGDLWDYLYELHTQESKSENIFIPWALEMGSWNWIKKSPRQLFSSLGHFNPLKPHRYRRIMRRHYFLLDFFFKSVANADLWIKN